MDNDFAWLGGWEGYGVTWVDRRAGPWPEVWIYLSPVAAAPLVCDGCGGEVREVHEIEVREVRDLLILFAQTWLWVTRRRVTCPRCGIKKVLWVGRGRGRADVLPFFKLLGGKGRNRLKHDKTARKVVKSARWPLLGNRDTIQKDEDRVRLDERLAANQTLMTACVLKDDLKGPWSQRSEPDARAAWKSGFQRTLESGISLLVAVARKLEKYLSGHQANGIQIPRRRILLPHNPRCVPRQSRMNQKKAAVTRKKATAAPHGRRNLRRSTS